MFLWFVVNHPWKFETNVGETTEKKELLDCTMNLEGVSCDSLPHHIQYPIAGYIKNRKGLSPSEPKDSARDWDRLPYDVLQVVGNRRCTAVIDLGGIIIRVERRPDRQKRGSTSVRLPRCGRCVSDIRSPVTCRPTHKPGQEPQACR